MTGYVSAGEKVAGRMFHGDYADGAQADGVQADGAQVDGVQVDGVQADRAQFDGVQADGVLVAEAARSRVRLAEVTGRKLDVERHRVLVRDRAAGAEVVFCGVVRDHDHDRVVRSLEYTGHPDARLVLGRIAAEVAADPHVLGVAVSHRIGALSVGDVALVAAVSCEHRQQAFALCADLVDRVKRELPIWKRQLFADGTDEWVNCP